MNISTHNKLCLGHTNYKLFISIGILYYIIYNYSCHAMFVLATVLNTGVGELVKINNCTCPGDILVYNCIVNGKGFTIWKGSAFQCPTVGSMISLQHSTFGGSGTKKSCNAGAIIGSSIGVSIDNSTYTSQLLINLTASSSAIGGTVNCVYRNISGSETTIGSAVIQITG